MECNCGDFSLRWDENGTILERGGTRGERVRCDIQTLTTMLFGYRRPTYLRRVERLEAGDAAVRILEDLIPNEQPYFSDYF
jgi:predicted acetyltransferase